MDLTYRLVPIRLLYMAENCHKMRLLPIN